MGLVAYGEAKRRREEAMDEALLDAADILLRSGITGTAKATLPGGSVTVIVKPVRVRRHLRRRS